MSESAMKPNNRSSEAGFTDNLGRVKDDITGLGRDVAATARTGMSAAKETLSSTYDAAKDKGEEVIDTLAKQFKARPVTCAAVALGVGLLVGMYFFRPRS